MSDLYSFDDLISLDHENNSFFNELNSLSNLLEKLNIDTTKKQTLIDNAIDIYLLKQDAQISALNSHKKINDIIKTLIDDLFAINNENIKTESFYDVHQNLKILVRFLKYKYDAFERKKSVVLINGESYKEIISNIIAIDKCEDIIVGFKFNIVNNHNVLDLSKSNPNIVLSVCRTLKAFVLEILSNPFLSFYFFSITNEDLISYATEPLNFETINNQINED